MAHTLLSAGDNTATYSFTEVYVDGQPFLDYLSAPDWAQLPEGRLKNLMSAVYTSEIGGPSNYEQFYAALASAGFNASISTGRAGCTPTATLQGGSGPAVIGYDSAPLIEGDQGVLHICLVHSIAK